MGLDITAYRNLTAVKHELTDDEICENERHVQLWVNSGFTAQADGLTTGCYETAAPKEEKWFRAGSYSGYSEWREALAKLAGYPAVEVKSSPLLLMAPRWMHAGACWQGATGPFSELINFSDCEGLIGPKTSAKLAADFRQFDEAAQRVLDDYSYGKYCEWRIAFELASANGAVSFH